MSEGRVGGCALKKKIFTSNSLPTSIFKKFAIIKALVDAGREKEKKEKKINAAVQSGFVDAI